MGWADAGRTEVRGEGGRGMTFGELPMGALFRINSVERPEIWVKVDVLSEDGGVADALGRLFRHLGAGF